VGDIATPATASRAPACQPLVALGWRSRSSASVRRPPLAVLLAASPWLRPFTGGCLSITVATRGGRIVKLKDGYEGLIITGTMFLVTMVMITITKLFF
jgi:hypothetical protein